MKETKTERHTAQTIASALWNTKTKQGLLADFNPSFIKNYKALLDYTTTDPVALDNIFSVSSVSLSGRTEFKPENFAELTSDGDFHHYVWIELSKKGQIIVIGRARANLKTISDDDPSREKAKLGDLFDDYQIHMGKTARLIAKCDKDYQKHVELPLKNIRDEINDYVAGAVIIPINAGSTKVASKLETEIGDIVVEKYGALNPTSHRYY
ncbi:hypothetical protein [Lacticaseibacillus hegangensis]|uniref:Uncharacterized protein n=1 Tax=Lacticaseibacillus hegangensis TaxID=2486010 RepID=A0ABW4CYH9_9LACO|nr:hypothetical protein [Lacticaseibacillus hegangensis]